MQWNLHIVGESLEGELEELLQKLVVDLEGIGHKLSSATLTTDTGQKSLATTPPEPEPVQTVGGEPVTPTDVPATPAGASAPSDTSTPASLPDPDVPAVDTALSPEPGETVAPIDGGPVVPDGSETLAVTTDTPPSLGDSVTPA